MPSVLFVCTGNICRSPTAEGVFRAVLKREGLSRKVEVDSAGTHDYQIGNPPDARAVKAAWRRGYDLNGIRARRVETRDFSRFDWMLAMDRQNLALLNTLRPAGYRGHLKLFLDVLPNSIDQEVPDPYRASWEAFEHVLDLVERGCEALAVDMRRALRD